MKAKNVLKELARISILGRVSYAIVCLHSASRELKVKSDQMSSILTHFNRFTESADLSKWEREMRTLLPEDEGRLEGHGPDSKSVLFLDALLWHVWDIAIGNIYSSRLTLDPFFSELLIMMEKRELSLPDPTPFQRFRQSWWKRGWGEPFPIEPLLKEMGFVTEL